MCSIRLKSRLQVGLFLWPNTTVRSKSIYKLCNYKIFDSIQNETRNTKNTRFNLFEIYILEYYSVVIFTLNLFNKIDFLINK